jgi:uncharacterized protein with GYD domain
VIEQPCGAAAVPAATAPLATGRGGAFFEAAPPPTLVPPASIAERRSAMATYIVLVNFTEQGLRNVKDTTRRADAVKELAAQYGVTAKAFYWTLGKYDMVSVFEAPDDASITSMGLAIGSAGNVRTQTLRAFSREEMDGVLSRLG